MDIIYEKPPWYPTVRASVVHTRTAVLITIQSRGKKILQVDNTTKEV